MKRGRDKEGQPRDPQAPLAAVRLDVFLDVACLCPTRSQAALACSAGKVDVNGYSAQPHKLLHVGDELKITLESGKRSFVVKQLLDRHVPKAVARTLFEETTPPLSPLELEARRLERQLAPRRDAGKSKLSKKERRDRDQHFREPADES
ncbi:MAG: S4 domain-containing protein [Thermoanaerobaculia bacterium]